MPWDTRGDQRAVGRSPFFPFTTWVLGIIHGLSGLTEKVFSGWALTQICAFILEHLSQRAIEIYFEIIYTQYILNVIYLKTPSLK